MRLFLVVCVLASLTGESKEAQEFERLASPLLKFGIKFLVHNKFDQKNAIFSPVSLHSAISSLLLVAEERTQTLEQIEVVLNLAHLGRKHETLHSNYSSLLARMRKQTEIADRLSPSSGVKKAKTCQSDECYQAAVLDFWSMSVSALPCELNHRLQTTLVNFYNTSIRNLKPGEVGEAIYREIKRWTKKAGFSDGILKKEDLKFNGESLTLLTAIRVAANWVARFTESQADFYNFGELKKQSNFFGGSFEGKYLLLNEPNGHGYHLEARIVSIPLHNVDELTFDIIQPLDANCVEGCDEKTNSSRLSWLERKLEVEKSLEQALEQVDRSEKVWIQSFEMPAFKFESNLDAKRALKKMGMKLAFSRHYAELTNICQTFADVIGFVSKLDHKAMIEVGNYGIKAAALTILKIPAAASNYEPTSRPNSILIDRPFFFVVRYAKIPILMGHLNEV